MTDAEIRAYYINLLILQYKGKPRAEATLDAFLSLVIDGQIFNKIQEIFDVDTASGVNLDLIGKIVGVTREGYSFSGPMTLDDIDYRKIIKLKIISNNSDSSLNSIENLLDIYFEGLIQVFDYSNMTMSYFISSALGSQQLVEFFINKGLLPKPMAVGLGATIYNDSSNFFGYRTWQSPNPNAFPYNTWTDYQTTWPFLTWAYAVNSPVSPLNKLVDESGNDFIVQENGDYIYV